MSERDIVERLQAPANWLRQDRGVTWKEATNQYDRAPFDAADAILYLRSKLADARRAGWIAGRDAAAKTCLHLANEHHNMLSASALNYAADCIVELEPPA